MSLTGDFGRLDRLVSGVGDLANPTFRREVLESAKPVISSLFVAEFQLSTGPRGAKWKRLKRPREAGRPNKGGPLYDSGNLREQASNVSVIGSGLYIFVTAPGAALHQYGRKNTGQSRDERGRFLGAGGFPARPYLPKAPALPTPWQRGINTAATNVLGVVLRTK